jgi:uncharacterized membrane protein
VLGVGLGALIYAAMFFSLLQWHHMRSADVSQNTAAGLEDNMRADGVFVLVGVIVVIIGAYMMLHAWLKRREPATPVSFAGLMLFGWGLFNLVEGLVDHHLLKLHHVRDDVADSLGWDIGFLVFAVLQVLAGYWLYRFGLRRVGSAKQPRLVLPPLNQPASQEPQQ